ncbi:MAG: MBOAT family protein [Alistipes sp.]|nr:MBOAT family protein [Alistipes sp.]
MDFSLLWHNITSLLSYSPESPMIFSSGTFWALFLLFMPLYALLKNSRYKMMLFVVAFSLYFYYKSSGWFFLLLVGTSLFDWTLSRVLVKRAKEWQRKLCVAISIVASLGVLCYFKYANFFLENWAQIVGDNFQPLDIILPVGISFYTFQSISYIVDVYRGRVAPTDSWLEYAFFLSFFPALVAGPIVRADYFLPQVKQNRRALLNEIWLGMWLILLGVLKKALIADYISQYNDLVFVQPEVYQGVESLMGVVGYTMQIYCDFSGYSDMAIGIALIMGFRLSPNFNFPYKSTNLTEFWHRWHISLSSWLRDYVYIPLGGNRKGAIRTYVNNFLTMLIGGLWHGASWKFVFWGAMHGVGLAVHKLFKPLLKGIPDNWAVKTLSWILTMSCVAFLWIFFRADSWSDAWFITTNIFTNFHADYLPVFLQVRYVWCIFMALLIAAHAMPEGWWSRMGERFVRAPWIVKLLVFVVVVQLVLQFKSEEVTPFIYFQF